MGAMFQIVPSQVVLHLPRRDLFDLSMSFGTMYMPS